MSASTPKRTSLYDTHLKHTGKIVEFAGWEMPVLYSGIIPEHTAVRTAAGMFDVSHMGEILIEGPQAEFAVEYMTCNDVRGLYNGKAQYTAITNIKGGAVDDIIVYKISAEQFLLCVNASNSDKDFAWLKFNNKFNCEVTNVSGDYGQIALQGPRAAEILSRAPGGADVKDIKYFHFKEGALIDIPVLIARTGYTGEDGFEIFMPWNKAADIWALLMELGAKDGLIPCGLGARDSLRLEACFPLYGHELRDDVSLIESGLSWVVKFDRAPFIGKEPLLEHKQNGAPRKLVGFFVDDPGIVRENEKIFSEGGEEIGFVTSGTKTPTLNRALGLALIKTEFGKPNTKIFAEVRGRKVACHVVKTPFYKSK